MFTGVIAMWLEYQSVLKPELSHYDARNKTSVDRQYNILHSRDILKVYNIYYQDLVKSHWYFVYKILM